MDQSPQLNMNSNISDESYLNIVENELHKYNYSLKDSIFIQQIIILLDRMSSPDTFNKTLFSHIIEFAKLYTSKPINLREFFVGYLNAYTTMKFNRDKLVHDIINTNEEIANIKKEIVSINAMEIVKEDGITSNSVIQFIFKVTKEDAENHIKNVHVNLGVSEPIEFEIQIPSSNKELKISSSAMLDFPLEIYVQTDSEDKLINRLNVRELLESSVKINYEYFEISIIWINSMVSFLNKKITFLEQDTKKSNEHINLLNSTINQMEIIMKTYFTQNQRTQKSNLIVGALGNEMVISDKIESLILKAMGKEMILIWDKIVYLLNKIMFLFVLFELYHRFDLLTVIYLYNNIIRYFFAL